MRPYPIYIHCHSLWTASCSHHVRPTAFLSVAVLQWHVRATALLSVAVLQWHVRATAFLSVAVLQWHVGATALLSVAAWYSSGNLVCSNYWAFLHQQVLKLFQILLLLTEQKQATVKALPLKNWYLGLSRPEQGALWVVCLTVPHAVHLTSRSCFCWFTVCKKILHRAVC